MEAVGTINVLSEDEVAMDISVGSERNNTLTGTATFTVGFRKLKYFQLHAATRKAIQITRKELLHRFLLRPPSLSILKSFYLHPPSLRKIEKFLTPTQISNVKATILVEASSIIERIQPHRMTPAQQGRVPGAPGPKKKAKPAAAADADKWLLAGSMMDDSDSGSDDEGEGDVDPGGSKEIAKREMNSYEAAARGKEIKDTWEGALAFWGSREARRKWPALALAAQSYLVSPAHEATSERTFSYVGRVMGHLNWNLSTEKACLMTSCKAGRGVYEVTKEDVFEWYETKEGQKKRKLAEMSQGDVGA